MNERVQRLAPDIESLEDLLAAAYMVEEEAGECLLSLAHQMEVHHNVPMAMLFRRLSEMRREQAAAIYASMRPEWRQRIYARDLRWLGESCPGAVDIVSAHYRMQPAHGLRLALAAFGRIHDFYDEIVHTTEIEEVRQRAIELRAHIAEHIRELEEELARTPEPDDHWDHDDDPPMYQE